MCFDYNGIEFNLKISGIMDSPEYVSKIKDDFSANVDLDGFGAGYVMEDTIKLKFDENNISYFYRNQYPIQYIFRINIKPRYWKCILRWKSF